MKEKIVSQKDLIPTLKEGSFLELTLAPGYYSYVRKGLGLTSFTYYDLLVTTPLRDLNFIAAQPLLLTVSLFSDPAWPVIGHAPLAANWPCTVYTWAVEPLPYTEEEVAQGVKKLPTEYFLLAKTAGQPLALKTPATPASLQGLPRNTVYRPETIEEKLRLHYGLTLTGSRQEPLPLRQQPLW